MNEGTKQEANNLIDLVEDSVKDLDKFSVANDDCFSSEVYEMYELVKRARRQLGGGVK